uniref:Interleukin 6 receptor n=1 Tax=Chelonoidis abingdonii TaxID=106734 RepID=A0A8C0GA78_CHEAB
MPALLSLQPSHCRWLFIPRAPLGYVRVKPPGRLRTPTALPSLCPNGSSPPAALPPDMVLSTVGANVTLPCLQWQPDANGTISWKVENKALSSEHAVLGPSLLLRLVQYNDSGRYSCYVGGCLVHSLRLLVEAPPEPPSFSCYRRSHVKDILCEWQPQRRPSPRTRAVLWVKKWLSGKNATEQRCRYFPKVEKFTCRVTVPPSEDDTFLLVSVCVSNGAGSTVSKDQVISANRVLKPDPPVNVLVEPVKSVPQKLRVNWTYPPSWDPKFYRLHFQVRYRAERSQSYTEIDQLRETSLVIHDAWHGARHMVQVRGLEEFGHGSWSEWSQEAMGTPWAGRTMREGRGGFPSDYDFYTVTFTFPPRLYGTEGTNGNEIASSPRCWSVRPRAPGWAGLPCQGHKKWRRGSLGQGKASTVVQHPLVPLAPPTPTSPLSEAPLLSPPAPFDVTNMDYLLVPQ